MRLSRLDWLLLLMTLIWGTNYALVKTAFRELDPQAFNALRLVLASVVMASASLAVRRRRTATLADTITVDASTRRSALKAWGSSSRKAVLTRA